MKTHEHRPQQLNKQPASAGTLGGKGRCRPSTTFNTLDNWAIKTPPNQKGKGPERKGYRVMARNMYTIHSVTLFSKSSPPVPDWLKMRSYELFGLHLLFQNRQQPYTDQYTFPQTSCHTGLQVISTSVLLKTTHQHTPKHWDDKQDDVGLNVLRCWHTKHVRVLYPTLWDGLDFGI